MTTQKSSIAFFDIRNFQDQLEPAKEKGKYICPACGGHNLSIAAGTGAYNCFNGCDRRDIREAIKPWAEVVEERKGNNYTPSLNKKLIKVKAVKPEPAQIPESELVLVKLPDPATDIPQPQDITSKPPKGIPGNATQTIYSYSEDQWVIRYQWTDTKKDKGYDKSFRQFHRLPDGTPEMRKGDNPWAAYRLDEAIAAAKSVAGTPVLLQQEGEGCVEILRELGLANFTFLGSSWDKKSIIPEYQKLKDSGMGLIVFLHDADDTGLKKLQTCQECADEVGIPFIGINPHDICPDLPYISSDIKEIIGKMDITEFIRKLELEIHAAVAARSQQAEIGIINAENQRTPVVSFLQQAFEYLYGEEPWICAADKLYWHTGNHYKHSPDATEIRRITKFCDAFVVENEQGKITCPYASPNWVEKVLKWAKMKTAIDAELLNPPGVNCINGIVRVVWVNKEEFTIALNPHTPDEYYIYEPLIEYDPNADATDCDRLLSCLDKPQQEILLRNLAASLDIETVRKLRGREVKALLAVGLGSNGKDALRECISIIFGDTGMTSVTLADFQAYDEGRKFGLAPLMNSRINWASENPQTCKIDKIQSLKLFVTGNKLHYERKGKDHIEFTPKSIGIFNLNETPSFLGAMQAILDRIGVLEFRKTFVKNPDPNNPNELLADPRFAYDKEFIKTNVAPAFLNKMLAALNDLVNEGIDYECTTDAFKNLQKENNHLFEFIESANIGYVKGGEMTGGELWMRLENHYKQDGTLTIDENGKRTWIDQVRPSDKNVKGVNQVIARISQLFPKAEKGTKYCNISKRNIPVLKGIGIIDPTRTTLELPRTTPAPLTAPETTLNQDFRTTRTTFSDSGENNVEEENQNEFASPPMTKYEEYPPQTDAGGAEALQDKENSCGESGETAAVSSQSGAGKVEAEPDSSHCEHAAQLRIALDGWQLDDSLTEEQASEMPEYIVVKAIQDLINNDQASATNIQGILDDMFVSKSDLNDFIQEFGNSQERIRVEVENDRGFVVGDEVKVNNKSHGFYGVTAKVKHVSSTTVKCEYKDGRNTKSFFVAPSDLLLVKRHQ